MILTNEFQVYAPIDRVWQLLDQVDAVVPCLPGASFLGEEGGDYRVGIRMKIGAISTHFQGFLRFEERNETTHTIKIRGTGKDTSGKGSATAIITAVLEPRKNLQTHVAVKTDLAITGKIAQFGGGVITDISTRLMADFARTLQKMIQARQSESSPPTRGVLEQPAVPLVAEERASVMPEAPALDLGHMMLSVITRTVWKNVAIPTVFFLLGWLAARYL